MLVWKCLTEKISVEPKVNWLEYILCRARAKQNGGNIYLIVFNTGRAIVTTNDDINFNKALSSLPEAYITINLDKLFSKMIKNSNNTEKSEHSYELSDNEITVLPNIHTSEADKINIKLKDGKISLIEKVFIGKKNDFKSLREVIESIGYGEANLKIENGKVIYIQKIEKKKLGDNQ